MRKKIFITFIATGILLTCTWLVYREYSKYSRGSLIVGPETEEFTIYIEPDISATRAAANYLALAIEQTLGKITDIITEQNEKYRGIRILCGSEFPEPEQRKAAIEFITKAEPANDIKDKVYSIHPDEYGVSIFIHKPEDCFGAVKAIADRWLYEDSGLINNSELYINQSMIDRQLSDLSTTVTGTIRILSQNLRNRNDKNGNTIMERAPRFFQLVEEYQPDLIGTQECPLKWLQLLQGELSDDYEIFGCSREGPDSTDGDWNAILYRKNRFTFQDGETFWLSNTPSTPDSKLNYDGSVRICTWALLQDSETGKTLLFSNTHLSNGRPDPYPGVRAQQVEILLWQLRKDKKLEEYPGFLTGDFNGEPDESLYSLATEVYEDSRLSAITNSSTVDYTFHNYENTQRLYDYCFHSPRNVTILDYHILDDQYGGFVSDHYGILVTAVLN